MGQDCACVSISQDSIQMGCVLSGAPMPDLLFRALLFVQHMSVSLYLCSVLLSSRISISVGCAWHVSSYSCLCCATLVSVQKGYISLIDCAGSAESNVVSEAGFGT